MPLLETILNNSSGWSTIVDHLLNVDSEHVPEYISTGCSSAYSCAQNIASFMAVPIMTNTTSKYQPFATWYYDYLRSKADPVTGASLFHACCVQCCPIANNRLGLWCSKAQKAKQGVDNCIGGSFHIDFVFNRVKEPFPFPKAQANTSLSLQHSDGLWSEGNAYLNIDGIYQATRPAIQAGKYRWDDVETACEKLLKATVPNLNNQTKLLSHPVSTSSHILPALVSVVAECQKYFPEMVKTIRPWPMCLDGVPYI